MISMEIDLILLHRNQVDSIDISGEYDIPLEYYQNSDVLGYVRDNF